MKNVPQEEDPTKVEKASESVGITVIVRPVTKKEREEEYKKGVWVIDMESVFNLPDEAFENFKNNEPE